jgi:hypothetical protein
MKVILIITLIVLAYFLITKFRRERYQIVRECSGLTTDSVACKEKLKKIKSAGLRTCVTTDQGYWNGASCCLNSSLGSVPPAKLKTIKGYDKTLFNCLIDLKNDPLYNLRNLLGNQKNDLYRLDNRLIQIKKNNGDWEDLAFATDKSDSVMLMPEKDVSGNLQYIEVSPISLFSGTFYKNGDEAVKWKKDYIKNMYLKSITNFDNCFKNNGYFDPKFNECRNYSETLLTNLQSIQELFNTNDNLKRYYRLESSRITVLEQDGSYTLVGFVSENQGKVLVPLSKVPNTNIYSDKLKEVDIRSAISFFDIPADQRARWLEEWLANDPGLAKFRNLFTVNGTKFYVNNQEVGNVTDLNPGQIWMKDKAMIPFQDCLALIAGPGQEGFGFFDDVGNVFKKAGEGIVDVGKKIGSGFESAYNWSKDRAEDVGKFATNAANSVADWTKGAANSTVDWAKGAGNTIVQQLLKVGNTISDAARAAFRAVSNTASLVLSKVKDSFEAAGRALLDTVNTVARGLEAAARAIGQGVVDAAMAIKNFVMDLVALAKKAFDALIDFLKTAALKVWDLLKKAIVFFLNTVSGGLFCQYILEKQVSDEDATKTAITIVTPTVREPFKNFCYQSMNFIVPGISVIFPLLRPLIDPMLNPQLDSLLFMALKPMSNAIMTLIDPIARQFASECRDQSPPVGISDYDKIVDTTDFSKSGEPVIVMVAEELTEL